MPLLETQLARYFMQVAHAKSLSKAAIKLSTTQSNVTARIKQLEEQLGAQLFSRHSRGVALTAAGEVLLPYCEQIVKIAEAVQRQAANTGFSRPSLRVGVYHTAAAHLMPDLIAGFLSANRGVHLTVKMGSTEELRALLRDEQLDCAVIAAVAVDSALHVHSRFVDEMGWVFKVGLLSRSDAGVMDRTADIVDRAPRGSGTRRFAGASLHATNLTQGGVVYRQPVDVSAMASLSLAWRRTDCSPFLKNFVDCAIS